MKLLIVLLGLILGACGGSGGGDAVGGGPVDPREEIARSVLAGCSRDAFGEYLDLLVAFHDMTQLTTPTQVAYIAVNDAEDQVSIEFDLDSVPGAEYVGTVRFLNPTDQTVVPFDLQSLVDGTSLRTALGGVAGDVRLLVTFISAGGGNTNGQFIGTIDNGIATQVRGNLSALFGTDCSTTFSLRLTPIPNFNGAFPGATSDFSMRFAPDLVIGVVIMNQTNAAGAEVVLNGTSDPFTFLVNLQTGVVTTN